MNEFLLSTHSWLRWVVLLLFLLVIFKNYTGWKSNRAYNTEDKKWNTLFIASMHLQALIGLTLYFISPMMKTILADFGGSMKVTESRFWSLEHIMGMFMALVIAQVGSIKANKKQLDGDKFKTAFVYYLIALLIILLMIPFGIWNVERPFFRL